MKPIKEFASALAQLKLTHVDRAIAFLWYYRESQQFEERTASELAGDMHEEGFPKANVTVLNQALKRSRFAIRGSRTSSFQIDVRRLDELRQEYGELAEARKVDVPDTILPSAWFSGTRPYLEKIVHQINGCYEYGFYDGCAALCRRLMESLIIEVYIQSKRHHEIQNNRVFLPLEKLINYIQSDGKINLSRNSPKTMMELKSLGDTAAHDRVYITEKMDIDDIKQRYRRLVSELLQLANIMRRN